MKQCSFPHFRHAAALAAILASSAACADRHWTGGGETADWSDGANWGAGNNSGNWVFGGGQIGSYPSSPDLVVVEFSTPVEISSGIWIENESKPNVVWKAADGAAADAGLKTTWGTKNSLNIGTGKHGGLTIASGLYYMPKQIWIGNGSADSYFTLEGGVFTNNSYVCIGYGAHDRTATMTVTGGEFYEKVDKFIIGQGNHAGCVGVYNQTGGTVSVPELFMSENNGSSSLALSGGTFEVRSWGRVGLGANTICDIAVSGGEFDTDGELILGCGNNSKVDMTLSGGLFKPKKLWIGSRYDSDSMTFTTTGCDATVTVTDDGTLTTDSGQDIVLGGRENANGTLTVEDGTVSCGRTLHVGWKGNGVLDVQGGAVSASAVSMGSDTTTATGTVHMTSGTLTSSGNVSIGMKGEGLFEMSGGAMKTSGEFWVGGEGNASSGNAGSGRLVMTGGSITNTNWTSIGRNGNGILELKGGLFEVTGNGLEIGRYNSSTGIVVVTGGTLKKSSSNQYLAVGHESDYGALILSNGVVSVKAQIQVAKGSRNTGYLSVSGGELTCNDLLQVGLNGNGTFEMDGGSASCTGFRLGTDNANAVGTANISGGSLVASGDIYVANGGTGTLNLKGGVLTGNKAMVGNGTGTLNLDGGTLQARQNNDTFIVDNERLTVNIGAGGAVFDSAGYNITIPATLNNADGLVGNGMIWKKGLGTLTISSNLDLARTFKFTINNGVGPIALTGTGNTLDTANGAKLTVALDPHQVAIGTTYTLLSGLGELTTDDMVLPAEDDMYAYSWDLTDGTLSVTVTGYAAGAPVTARYENGAWVLYDGNGNVTTKTESESTVYVFTGAEPSGALESISATRRVTLESGTFSISTPVTAGMVTIPENATVTLSGSDTASFTATELVNNGTLTFAEVITFDAPLAGGNINIEEGAVLSLAQSQSPTAVFTGTGELLLENVDLHVTNTSYFQSFQGTITVGEGARLYDDVEWHCESKQGANHAWYGLGEHTTIKMAGGSIPRFSAGGSNNEYIGNVVIADGTDNEWINTYSRGGWQGLNIELKGSFSGTGTLRATCSARHYRFESDLSEFGGTVEMSGSAFGFKSGINGGTWIANSGSVLYDNLSVNNATLVIKGNHSTDPTISIGATGVLKVADDAKVQGISFAAGAQLELLDDGALSDTTQSYVALVSATPISAPLPTLVQPETVNRRGSWRLFQESVEIPSEEEGGDSTYEYHLTARFAPSGFIIIVR